jgi:hypothetical protein
MPARSNDKAKTTPAPKKQPKDLPVRKAEADKVKGSGISLGMRSLQG